ncbi:MAG TPA: ferredoxin [Rhodospirillaceae bacterium]|nr:ferredoxin [Rhodospirillaceae bacterium]|tara:strand:- start:66910 stop:67230 length:321 start_codon:yes stop_codon:yes gene_type:complete
MKIIVTDFEGKEHELEAVEGWRVMEIIRDYGLPIKAECGGSCACATCHVYVEGEWLDKLEELDMVKSDDEEDMLDEVFDLQDNSRLSCQIIMCEELDGLRVTLAPC